MMLIAVCFHRFGPYHVARLTAASQRMNIAGIEFSAFTKEYAWTPVETRGGFRRITVVPEGDIRSLPKNEIKFRVWKIMDDLKPDVVAVNGWSAPDALAVLSWSMKEGVPVVMMSESTAWDFKRSAVKERIKLRIISKCSCALVGGSPHRQYINTLGMPNEKIFTGYDVVDNNYFYNRVEQIRLEPILWREILGLPERFFLASARFIPKKNLLSLIRAYASYRYAMLKNTKTDGQCNHLILLGDGELRPEIELMVRRLNLQDVVHFPGFIQYPNLPVYYGLADLFVHASITEQWGLVVNEAMASGLPVVVSERCGCAPDLVENGRNGYTFDPRDVDALARLMVKMSSDDCDRRAMGRASREIISRWTPETFAEGLAGAVETALASPRLPAGLLDNLLLRALNLQ